MATGRSRNASRSRAARAATWLALAGRAVGSFAVSSMTSALTAAGTPAGSGGSGASWQAATTSIGVPWNGGRPARHS